MLTNYQEETMNDQVDESVLFVNSLEDANAIVRKWIALSSMSSGVSIESTTISVLLPSSVEAEATIQLPIQPLLKAFQQT